MSIHCHELGWIGKYAFLGPRDLPQPSALEIALGLRPRAISRDSGCKIPASANLSILGGVFSNTSLLSAVYCYTLLLTMFIAFQKIWEYLSWIKNAIDSKCFPPLRREVCPLWGNMTRRHNGTINDQAGKQKHHPLYFVFNNLGSAFEIQRFPWKYLQSQGGFEMLQ